MNNLVCQLCMYFIQNSSTVPYQLDNIGVGSISANNFLTRRNKVGCQALLFVCSYICLMVKILSVMDCFLKFLLAHVIVGCQIVTDYLS